MSVGATYSINHVAPRTLPSTLHASGTTLLSSPRLMSTGFKDMYTPYGTYRSLSYLSADPRNTLLHDVPCINDLHNTAYIHSQCIMNHNMIRVIKKLTQSVSTYTSNRKLSVHSRTQSSFNTTPTHTSNRLSYDFFDTVDNTSQSIWSNTSPTHKSINNTTAQYKPKLPLHHTSSPTFIPITTLSRRVSSYNSPLEESRILQRYNKYTTMLHNIISYLPPCNIPNSYIGLCIGNATDIFYRERLLWSTNITDDIIHGDSASYVLVSVCLVIDECDIDCQQIIFIANNQRLDINNIMSQLYRVDLTKSYTINNSLTLSPLNLSEINE